MGIETPLDTVSIASRDGSRGTFQGKLSRRWYASATSPLDKGKRPQAQDSQSKMRDDPDSQDETRTAQGPITDENRWERAAAQFKSIGMSEEQEFSTAQDSQSEMSEIQDSQDEMRTTKDPIAKQKQKRNKAEFGNQIRAWQEQRGYPELGRIAGSRSRIPTRRITNRPRAGTPRAKWLNELEDEEDLGIPTRFEERHTKGCHDAAMTRYFFTDEPYTLTQLYQKWYKQRGNDEWEDFYMWLDEKVVQDIPITEKRMSHIKGALIMTSKDLEHRSEDWRIERRISVPAKEFAVFRSPRERFELKSEDEPRVNPKHPAHHTLAWIACVDDMCETHKAPKVKNKKYPARMHWMKNEQRYRNAKYMHGWHPTEDQEVNHLTLQPGRYLTEECLDGRQWWECPENTCPWHVEDKKRTRHWPTSEPSAAGSSQQSGKGEAHGTRGNQW
jgi:hypothetical protein